MKKLIKEHYGSVNLYEKLSILSESQLVAIANGIEWTVNNYPNAVLIGGTALVYYLKGGRDLTPDIDFMVDDMELLKSKLDNEDILYKAVRVGNLGLLGITVEDFNTDYLDANVGNKAINSFIFKTFKYAKINNINVKIINPELLAIMKLELGRDKDMNDGFALIQSGILSKELYLRQVTFLKNNLNDYESIRSYAEMLK
jgi:hypothetical protein